MIPKNRRISALEFKTIKLSPVPKQGSFFSVRTSLLKNTIHARAAVVVSKKIAHSAVQRNAIRRRAYTILGTILPNLPQGLVVVLYAKKEAVRASFDEISSDIQKLVL
jgi:ribonuclease P protein component